ncbi:MAG: B12-binding domain-containing radical SAM protein, partial [Alphaproteobacteria bacterium]
MLRPIWLFSQDTSQFCAPPLTTGALKSHFLARGRTADATEVELVHFLGDGAAVEWLDSEPRRHLVDRAREAIGDGLRPVLGLSCYTWNVAEMLEIARAVKADVPGALVVVGGPHVQRAEDFLFDEAVDVVVLGEGEATFTEFLDAPDREAWSSVAGLAFLGDDGAIVRTPPRPRATDLDVFPSALDVVPLRGDDGRPLYRNVAYETSRGCPYKCSFCEWGTGAIGTKIHQFSVDRIRDDLGKLVDGGIQDIWFCDSNFGALKEDVAKAEIVIDLKRRTGLPQTFASSWSKNHNARVQEIVRRMHREGLLWHYHLALQTLTPLALELSHRTNMRANDYEPIVRSLADEGVPIAAELIWGLPGDNLAEFERNLDHLMTVFPSINIFG